MSSSPPSAKRHKPDDDDNDERNNSNVSINRALTFQTRKKIDDAAQKNDRISAFEAYDAAKNDASILLPMHTLNVLLHLCSTARERKGGEGDEKDRGWHKIGREQERGQVRRERGGAGEKRERGGR